MSKKSESTKNPINSVGITTYQSGVAQATAYRIVKQHTATLLRDYNLTCMQWFTIGTVLDCGSAGIRISDLAGKLDTTLAYMTTTINLLESQGILNKRAHESDARTKIVTVSPGYIKTCVKIERVLKERLRDVLYKNLSREELGAYINVLNKISAP